MKTFKEWYKEKYDPDNIIEDWSEVTMTFKMYSDRVYEYIKYRNQ